eukprot:COSAG01_NODE_10540_length_2136_cov_1.128130_2_plen_297_part_00
MILCQGNLSQIHVTDSDVEVIDTNLAKCAAIGISIIVSSGDSGSGYAGCPCYKGVSLDGTVEKIVEVETMGECCQFASNDQNAKGWTFVQHITLDGWQPGVCTLYKTMASPTSANYSTFSGFANFSHPQQEMLWPSWPASSPWVTAVGATRFIGEMVGNAEKAADQFGSGGGFSRQFDQTDAQYQVTAVAKYMSTVDPSTLPPATSYAATGRGTPDVSFLGEGYQVIIGGRAKSVGGTSATAPAFAGMVSLLNEARFRVGKKQLGFLNPFLYANADSFTDVVKGTNKIGRKGQSMM